LADGDIDLPDAGVERGTSMDASNISCSPYSQARCTPGSPTLEGKFTNSQPVNMACEFATC